MRDWELVDSDRFSFEDSDRFEEDSLCSWISEPESLCNNWRGWKKANLSPNVNTIFNGGAVGAASSQGGGGGIVKKVELNGTPNLVELAAITVASHIPFEVVERFYPPVPEQLQLRIAFWSFPEHEEDIRLYSCLANGSAEEFIKGERLFKNDCVGDILQIGFHLSATVKPSVREAHKVAVTFDRRRITTCTCSCNASTNWCGHVVAVCLHRIFQAKDVTLRAPVSESLSRLQRDQLQKFAQYLISELPQQILPTAQRLLDELLSSQRSAINTLRGAPDPTAGASAHEQTTWFLDEKTLHGNIHKILIKFCVPAPIVFSDVNYLSSAAPPASAEWSSLLRPLRGREPEGIWNLLSIVREMFRREDRNAIPLLEVITEECLNCDQILVWWFNTKVALHNGNSGHGGKHSVNSNAHACQHAGSSLCDEIVILWRLAALNPGLSPEERSILLNQFKEWHVKIVEKVSKSRNASIISKHAISFKNDVEAFPGFRPAIEACYVTWDSYPIPGITYSESSRAYLCPFMSFRHSDGHSRSGDTGMIHSSHAVLNNPAGEHHLLHSSATISSAPGITKRPRSVDCAERTANSAEGDMSVLSGSKSSTFSSDAVAGPSSAISKPAKLVKNARKSRALGNEQRTVLASSKCDVAASKFYNSFDGEIPSTSDTAFEKNECISNAPSPHLSVSDLVTVLPPVPPVQQREDRSSISSQSEGFCDNEGLEIEIEGENDEGVETDSRPQEQVGSLNTTGSDEVDEADNDADADSDSSIFARSGADGVEEPSARKFDSSDSQQSGDEYQLYYYDTKTPVHPNKKSDSSSAEDSSCGPLGKDQFGVSVFSHLKRIEDPWDMLFARAEGLHAHGHSKEACKLGAKLATDLLANPPKLTIDIPAAPVGKGKRKKVNPISHQVSCLASTTLAKCGFLCTVLADNPEHFFLAFQVGMFGLEMARPPASTKPLEVKLANQEAELAQLLKRIPVGYRELEMMREKADNLKNGNFKSRGEALLPLVLANFIFDVLVMPTNRDANARCTLQSGVFHLPSDENLGFEAAVVSLGLKANVSEADHPLLCEGTRRQRGDLALVMLLNYKDDPEKLAKIMDKLLDREIHQLYKAPLPAAYYSNSPPTSPQFNSTANVKSEEACINLNGEGFQANVNVLDSPATSVPPAGLINNGAASIASVNRIGVDSFNSVGAGEIEPSDSNGEVLEVFDGAATAIPTSLSPVAVINSSSPVTTNGNNQHNQATGSVPSKSGRYKGKRAYPVLPNQPSEASAHFMFELAKIVLGKAGGSSNQSLFQSSNGQNPRGPHRALHMCAFHMGLYALGLHNAVSPNWLSRTYSSHVSWITGQAMEIGAPAIAFLIDTWDSHLTPPEAVTIADRASRGDANMVRAAAELALSCLPYSHALNPNEIHRAILQCKEQSDAMLEKSCLTVESAAKGGGVYPEVLFDVARQWFSLYQKHLPLGADTSNDDCNHHDSLLSLDCALDSMNTNIHGQLVCNQTGLPPLNPNNPPPPLPSSVSSVGPGSHQYDQMQYDQIQYDQPSPGPERIQLPHPNSHQHNGAVFSMATQQVPMPYGQVPYLPSNFNPMPGNFVYGQAVIYQANPPPNNPSTTSSSYYNPQQQPPQHQQGSVQQYMPQNMHPQFQHSQGHPGLTHAMVSTGPPLQFYPSPIPITSSSNGHPSHMNLRPTGGQFFPVHNGMMGNQGMHHNQSNNGPPNNVLTVVGPSGHPMMSSHVPQMQQIPPVSHHHSVGAHLIMSSSNSGMHHQGQLMQGVNPNPQIVSMMNSRNPVQPQMNNCGGHNMYMQSSMQSNNLMPPQLHPGNMQQHMGLVDIPPVSSASPVVRDSVVGQHQNGQSAIKVKYLLAAYRVGMLALEALARRVHDDRPQAKFARNPPYGEDVKWLLSISRKLGVQYLQQFCICAVSSISNPFVLHEIVLDASLIPTRNTLTFVYQNPRSPLAPLVQKCQQMYFQCLHQKLYHITASDYEDFVNIVCTAKKAFHLTPDGISQFKEWLTNLRRSKACKKELFLSIQAALQANCK